MVGILYILLFWVVGNFISSLIDGYISGNIIGMILLFIALNLKLVKPETVKPIAKFLLGTMALFFVPFGVGLMVSYELILENIWEITVITIISTILVLVCVGRIFQRLNRDKSDLNIDNDD